MKSDIRLERDGSEMNHYRDELVSVHAYLSALTNRDEETQRKILGKIFKKDTSLENVYDFVIDKPNPDPLNLCLFLCNCLNLLKIIS